MTMPCRFQIISILFRWKWHGTIKPSRGAEGGGNKEGWQRGSEMGRRKERIDEGRKGLPSPYGDLCLFPAIKPPSYNHEYNYHVVSTTEIEIIRRVAPRVPLVDSSDPTIPRHSFKIFHGKKETGKIKIRRILEGTNPRSGNPLKQSRTIIHRIIPKIRKLRELINYEDSRG